MTYLTENSIKTHTKLTNYINRKLDYFSNSEKEIKFLEKISSPYQQDQYLIFHKNNKDILVSGFNRKSNYHIVLKANYNNGNINQ